MMLRHDDQLVRRIEAELLDRNHLHLVIFNRDQQTAIAHVFKLLGDLLRDFESETRNSPQITKQVISNTMVEAVEHSIRWILLECHKGDADPGVDWEEKDKEALDLLGWAIHYTQLYLDHVAWSRGTMSPLVDLENRIITFDYSEVNSAVLLDQLDSDGLRADDFFNLIPESIKREIISPWLNSIKMESFHDLPIVPIDRESLAHQDAERWVALVILPELATTYDFGGFTLREYRHFYLSLWIYCYGLTCLEDSANQFLGSENIFGSRPLQASKDYVVNWLSQYCGVSIAATRNIIGQLTFSPKHRHPSLASHPFILSSDGILTLLPRLFASLDPNLMLLMALNTGEKRRVYELMIQGIESVAKKQLARLFIEHGYCVWEAPLLFRTGEDPLTPDLIVGRTGDDWIAIIEYKHALPPRGSAGVSDRIKETSKWLDKAKKYLIAATRLKIFGEN